MLQTIQYCKGYLCIKVWGFSTERFMNLCSNHNILLWNIENHGDYYTMCISLKGFYGLKAITRKTGTKVAITKRCGLPFFSQKMWKRKVFLAGLAGSFVFLLWIGNFILNIEIRGNYYVTEEVFTDFLSDIGIKEGIKKKNIDIGAVEKAIRNEYDIVTWTSVQLQGNRLIINVKENDLIQKKEIQDETEEKEGYHLIADRDGTVIDIITRSGVPKVKIGDEVKKGDILVEGCIPIYREDATIKRFEYCVADADVSIKSKLSLTEKINENYEKKVYTGKRIKRKYILFKQKEWMIPVVRIPYEKYDVLKEVEQVCILDGYKLPVYYGEKNVHEYMLEKQIYSKEEIKQKFEKKIQKFIQTLDEKGVQIIEKNVTINKNKSIWNLKVDFTITQRAETLQKVIIPQESEADSSDTEGKQGE